MQAVRLLGLLLVAASLAGCNQPQVPEGQAKAEPTAVRLTPAPSVPGNPENGRVIFIAKGCGGCHTLMAVPGAVGVAGPKLDNVTVRETIAGSQIPNTPANMVRWLMDPASLKPGTAMPNLGLTQSQAQDLAALLYALPNSPFSDG